MRSTTKISFRARRGVAALGLAGTAALAFAGCSQLQVADDFENPTSSSTTEQTTTSTTSATSIQPAPAPAPAEGEVPPPEGEVPPPEGDVPPPEEGEVPPPPAPEVGDQQRDNFIALTQQFDAAMPEGVDPVQVITEACGQLDQNAPVGDVINGVAERGQYDTEKAAFFLASGVPVYCDGNVAKLTG